VVTLGGEAVVDQTTLYALVGKRVRQAREKRGLTQKSLASLLSLTRTSVTNIERGKQKVLVHTLVELAQALHIPLVELLGEFAVVQGSEMPEWDELLKDRPRIEQEWIKAAWGDRKKER
jgi:transcriptional regulator with XRE-family HTH domain